MSGVEEATRAVAEEVARLRRHLDQLERDLAAGVVRLARAGADDLAQDVDCLVPKLDRLAAERSADFWARRRELRPLA